MAATATITAAAAAVVGTGYSVYSSNEARKQQADAADQARKKNDQLIAEQQQQQNQNMLDKAQTVQNAQKTAMAANSSSGNRGGTILTSPLGVTSPPPNQGSKTLLGS